MTPDVVEAATSTEYAAEMAKFINVQLRNVPNAVRVRADTIVREGDKMEVRDGKEIVGVFAVDDVIGWWSDGTAENRPLGR